MLALHGFTLHCAMKERASAASAPTRIAQA